MPLETEWFYKADSSVMVLTFLLFLSNCIILFTKVGFTYIFILFCWWY
jgi:hypothetical protein